ncbi:hypothetical protein KEM48_005699 [Puccinia striiformis f. sp. tritici PST-130]|nr:hypothetical protein KEM48_005699 [Puccinia striiformis f. sp. tritici PST-130]
MTFRPHFISRSRQATSTFTGGFGRVATGLGGSVLSAEREWDSERLKGRNGWGGDQGSRGVGKLGYAGIRRVSGMGGKKRSSVMDEGIPRVPSLDSDLHGLPPTHATQGSQSRVASAERAPTETAMSESPTKATHFTEDFKLNIVIIGLSAYENPNGKTYVHVKRNAKAVFDTKVVRPTATNSENELEFLVFEKRKLGKDREIGNLKIKLWEHVHPDQSQFEAELNEPLEGLDPGSSSTTGGGIQLRLKLTIIEASSSTNVGKEIYNQSRRSISVGNHGLVGLFNSLHHKTHSGDDQQNINLLYLLRMVQLNLSLTKILILRLIEPFYLGGKSQKSVAGTGVGRFSLYRSS